MTCSGDSLDLVKAISDHELFYSNPAPRLSTCLPAYRNNNLDLIVGYCSLTSVISRLSHKSRSFLFRYSRFSTTRLQMVNGMRNACAERGLQKGFKLKSMYIQQLFLVVLYLSGTTVAKLNGK